MSESTTRPAGFKGEYLWELEIAERQLNALADAFPPDEYAWRPDPKGRSVAEVLVHVAAGNFMLMGLIGHELPADLYPAVADAEGAGKFKAMVGVNDSMSVEYTAKEPVTALLKRSLAFVRKHVEESSDAELERSLFFFREQSTARRAYLRALVHMHEHMGQLVAYTRSNGRPAPWADWRPDRR